jgi:hypothetical protein
MLDPVAVERAEKSLDEFVNSRSKSKDKANEVEAMYAASARRHHARLREQNRWEWIRFFEHMRALHSSLAREHEARARALLEEPGGGA